MKKELKLSLLNKSKTEKVLVRVYFKYDDHYYYYYVNDVNDKLFLGQEENDFQLDGYHIRKISHITKSEIKDDLCGKINEWNGVTDQIRSPDINISSWHSIFEKLKDRPGFVIVEDEINEQFCIGKIVKVNKSSLIFYHFDANGIWQDEMITIPFSSITHVAWNLRYTNNWYDYLNRDKENEHNVQ